MMSLAPSWFKSSQHSGGRQTRKEKMLITPEKFLASVGRRPKDDDLERCNCEQAGTFGHMQCGWDNQRDMPVFIPGTSHRQTRREKMTKFNPENKESLTHGECLRPAMEITDQADADQYLAAYIAFIQRAPNETPRDDDTAAEIIAKANLGFFAGHYDNETRERVERLFKCSNQLSKKCPSDS